jgi:hypothetical protein
VAVGRRVAVPLLAALIGTAFNGATPSSGAADSAAPAAPPVPHRVIDSRDRRIIAKNPDAHEGERIIVYGRVTQ